MMKAYSLFLIIVLLGMNVYLLDQNIKIRYYEGITAWAAQTVRADYEQQREINDHLKGLYLECVRENDILENSKPGN